MPLRPILKAVFALPIIAGLLSACAQSVSAPQPPVEAVATAAKKEADRAAILAMAGDFEVGFNFIETVGFVPGYEPKEPKRSGGYESVRVIEARENFISLQHILVVGGDDPFPVKHWRQDWIYEPESVLTYVGGNSWEMRPVPVQEARGSWAQIVYQVDDSPRYGAVGAWVHEKGVSAWEPTSAWRPLPRRDATTRDDYHVIDAVNRHVITDEGWVHEQDNAKLVLTGEAPQMLVREVGFNTYQRFDGYPVDVAERYWRKTADYWAAVRAEWSRLETEGGFGLTVQGEPEAVYGPLLEIAGALADGDKALAAAIADAKGVIAGFTTTDPAPLPERLAQGEQGSADGVGS